MSLLVVGHRGAARLAPENTLASFQAALDAGAEWVEFDVRFTRDGVPVVIHDATLDRTTDGRGAVSRWSFTELARLDAGSWFDARFRGERVPSLRDVLRVLAGRAGANVEVKDPGPNIAEGVLAVLRELEGCGVHDSLVSSFVPEVVAAAADARARAGLLVRRGMRLATRKAEKLGARAIVYSKGQAMGRRVARAHSHGLAAWIYTVNDRASFLRAAKMGFDAVISDRPDLVREWRDGLVPDGGRL